MHIDIRDVSHEYQTNQGLLPVIKNLSISVKKGGFTAIVGPSGCGKSTITRLVSGLLKPSKGSIFISNEKVISPLSTVGMAYQNPVLLEWRNIINNIIQKSKISNFDKNLDENSNIKEDEFNYPKGAITKIFEDNKWTFEKINW